MPSVQEIDARERTFNAAQMNKSSYYEGHVMYRGQPINWKHSIKRVVSTLRRSLKRSQFASLNLVGIPGSGKGVLATNICTDLIEDEEKENGEHYELHWKGAEDLRNIGDVLESLPKGTNNIIIFDDVSKALESLSSTEQAEVFQYLTTTRHITGGKLLMISCYHYTFANLKSVKSQSVVVVYTSATLTEMGNISQMISGQRNQRTLNKFAKIYEEAFMKGQFELRISKHQKRMFIDGEPFRPCFVVNLFRTHIGLYLKLDNQYSQPNDKRQKLNSEAVVKHMTDAYGADGRLALRFAAMLKGYPEAMRNQVWSAFKMIQDLSKGNVIEWRRVTQIIKDPKQKRAYRKRQKERDISHLILKETEQNPEPIITDVNPNEPDDEFDDDDDFAEFHDYSDKDKSEDSEPE